MNSQQNLQNLIHYIEHHPVQHNFTEHVWDYPWSCYGSILSNKSTKLNRGFVVELFNGIDFFEKEYQKVKNYSEINDLIIEY